MNTLFISKTCTKSLQPSSLGKAVLYGFASLLLVAGVMPSCSTANGFGKDVEKVGDKIQEGAQR